MRLWFLPHIWNAEEEYMPIHWQKVWGFAFALITFLVLIEWYTLTRTLEAYAIALQSPCIASIHP